MQWEGKETSENVEDQRGMKKTGLIAGGGIGTLVIMALVYFLGIDPNAAKQLVGNLQGPPPGPQEQAAIDDKTSEFSKTIMGMTEKVWAEQFRANGYRPYEDPKMRLFREEVSTGCGIAQSAVGPFYCPSDRKVYLDFSFFDELEQRLGGSKADFSKAYVIAHEVGHHVQNLLGYSEIVDRHRGDPRTEKEYSVRLELQADYLAGCWAFHADKKYHVLETGDIEAALKTAKAIGDDKLQERARGYVNPREFTHGTATQRYQFFREGLKTGDASKARLDKFFSNPYRNGEILDR
jgi:predicted metalloprotease